MVSHKGIKDILEHYTHAQFGLMDKALEIH